MTSISRTTFILGIAVCLVVVMTVSGILANEQTQPVPSPAVSPVTPPVTPNPAPTSPPNQATVVAEPTSKPGTATAAVSEPAFRLYMTDGQLKSHPIRVYVTRDILPNQSPRLRLLRSHAVKKKAVDEVALEDPGVVAPGQEWIYEYNMEKRSMTLNEQDSGRTVDIELGKVVTVRLKENPTTGYRWTVETDSGLEQIGDHFKAGGAIGAAGVREFQFRPMKVGSYELRMKNWREWEGEGSVIDRFNVQFMVK
jgi:inhibitor of cysteine peptidase